METLPKNYMTESMAACEEYLTKLQEAYDSAQSTHKQIIDSATAASEKVDKTFDQLTAQIISLLNIRKRTLQATISRYQQEALKPISQCQDAILLKQTTAEKFLGTARDVLRSGGFKSPESYQTYVDEFASMGSLPAVPEDQLIPNITFQAGKNSLLLDLEDGLASYGSVSKIGPVQFSSIESAPGALLVRWETLDYVSDVHGYMLEMASDGLTFNTVYLGCDNECLVRKIKLDVEYAFRVCCRSDVNGDWSAWSWVKKTRTHLEPYEWNLDPGFVISDEGRLARCLSSGTLFSKKSITIPEHTIQFFVSNYVGKESLEGVALCCKKSGPLIRNGSVFISFAGRIFVNGAEKRMSMPCIGENSEYVNLGWQRIGTDRWRITIEMGDKGVTYDWRCSDPVHFAAEFHTSETQVFVH